jgi:2-oxo-4-hydroxy-4-carboxy-5-ureidoimidazoline decarboxylase
VTVSEINALPHGDFVERFGFLFEHSPWVAAAAAERRPYPSIEAMRQTMIGIVDAASEDCKLALLRAHPELAGKAAIDHSLTEASAFEQASAGLDRMTAAEFTQFHALNDAYRERFGFPFIICVRLTDKAGILAAMESRARNSREAEIATATAEVAKIAGLRLQDAVS